MSDLENFNIESGNVSESGSELTSEQIAEAARSVASSKAANAATMADSKQNLKLSRLLSLLLSVDNEKILSTIMNLVIEQKVEIIPVFSIFFPLFSDNQISSNGILDILGTDSKPVVSSMNEYTLYIKSLLSDYENLRQIDPKLMLGLIIDTIYYFNIGKVLELQNVENNATEFKQKLTSSIQKELF